MMSETELDPSFGESAPTDPQDPNGATDPGGSPDGGMADDLPVLRSEVEEFKLQVNNLPKYCSHKDLKKFLRSQLGDDEPKKIYSMKSHAYILFAGEFQRDRAMQILNGKKFKGSKLRVKRAAAVEDPISAKKFKKEKDSTKSAENSPTSILDVCIPLHFLPYDRQLEMKNNESKTILKEILKKFRDAKIENSNSCEISAIVPAPVVTEYRNKCEFTVGYGRDGTTPTVGFRMARYAQGDSHVESAAECFHLPKEMRAVATNFNEFLRSRPEKPFDVAKKCGFWRLLTVRCFRFDLMVIVTVSKIGDGEFFESLKRDLIEIFLTPNEFFRCTSLFLQFQISASKTEKPIHLGGAQYVYENLFGKFRFRISPESFFQTNSAGCEILYEKISEFCVADDSTILLDICCGTGTIGITLGRKAKKLIGIEICPEAIEDARKNSESNEISNSIFFAGNAEKIFPNFSLKFETGDRIVGILDPPRAGVADRLIVSIRKFEKISRIIFVACDPKAATKNFVDLCRPISNKFVGTPFRLIKIAPVDMFPQTNHFEWVMAFERGP